MNIFRKAKINILNGKFLTQEDLTQAQYDLITNPNVQWEQVAALHDELFGSHYASLKVEMLETGPYFPDFVTQPPTDWTDAEVEETAPAPLCPV